MSIKRSKFQRKMAHPGHSAKALPTQAPSPEESAALAASGIDLNRGSSTEDPLTDEGHEQLRETGEKLADKGGLDAIHASASRRAMESAQELAAVDPSAPPITSDPNLESWSQGAFEGQPEKLVKQQIRDLIRKNPNAVIPGMGAMTSRPSESFNDYKMRALPAIRGAMQQLAENPTAKIGIPLHSSVVKLTNGWLKKGAPDNFDIDPDAMDDEAEKPGAVSRLFPDKDGQWEIKPVDLDDKKALPPGLYLIRHGATPMNVPATAEKGTMAQNALAQIAKHVKNINHGSFGRAIDVGRKAVQAGHLSHDEVSDAIDQNLPSAEEAENLPNDKLMAVAAAASPKKKADYQPIIQRNFGDPAALPPALNKHLRDILPPPSNDGALPA